jgi:hypothetical protein
MPLETVCELFSIAKTTLKDAVQEHADGHYVEERREVLQALRTCGVVGKCASKVHILRISFAEKLMRTFDVDQHARDVLSSLSSSTPPPRPPSENAPTRWVTASAMPLRCLCDALPTGQPSIPQPLEISCGDRDAMRWAGRLLHTHTSASEISDIYWR